MILKNALLDNFSLVNLDCRINPGCSQRIQTRIALAMCKNIENIKSKGFPVKNDIDHATYAVGVGLDVLTRLDIKPKKHRGDRAARA